MEFLLDNMRQQMAVMRSMNKTPTKLVCDSDSFDCLFSEIAPNLSMLYPCENNEPMKVYGLEVEISKEPNFEVV